ncbi:MAG: outer membrane beta-barrel protein [Flavobacteriaceae bacterium]|nr:outer membrane beta-barrel protein [Flavobacteriaceae bacterium]
MKNSIFSTLVFLLLVVTPTLAQGDDSNKESFFDGWEFAVKAGVNFSNMYGDVGNNSFLIFPHAGAVIDKSITDEIILGFEPHISGEGQELNGGYDRIIYLNLPFVGKFKVADPLTLDGGIHVGVKLTEKTKFGTTGETDNRNRFKRIAPGVTGGATYDVAEDWFVQFRTNLKLSDVVRKEGGDSEGSTILSFQISIGHRFN